MKNALARLIAHLSLSMAMGDGVSTVTTCILEERGRAHTESLGMRRPSLQLTQEVIEFGLRLRRQFAAGDGRIDECAGQQARR